MNRDDRPVEGASVRGHPLDLPRRTFALRLTSEAEAPFLVTATKMPYDKKAPFGGWDIVEPGPDRELEIVVRLQPPR